MTDAEYNALYAQFKNAIRGMARKLARTDYDLFDDLVSVGMIRLWHLDLSKASTNADSWVRAALRNAMIDFLRQQRLSETESLNNLLAQGGQVVHDPDTGMPHLLSPARFTRLEDLYDDSSYFEPGTKDDA